MMMIFLCHANEDKAQIRQVYQHLKAEGFEPWFDEEDRKLHFFKGINHYIYLASR